MRASKLRTQSKRTRQGEHRIRELLGRAGHATLCEQLERRVLLGGDFPSFQLPLTPDSGFEITLDGNGEGDVNSQTGSDGHIDPAFDDDLFRFTAPADDFVSIWADTVNTEESSALDSRVEVYSIGGTLVAQGSVQGSLSGGMFDDGWAGFVAKAGETYFVRVLSDQPLGAGATGTYNLRIDALTQAMLPVDPDLEGGPLFVDSADDDNFPALEGIEPAGNDEVFRFTTGPDDLYDSLVTVTGQTIADDFDVRVDVFDSTGALVRGDSQTGHLTNPFLVFRGAPDSTYFVRVRGDTFDPDLESATGDFRVAVDPAATQLDVDPVTREVQTQTVVGEGLIDHFSFVAQGTGLSFITSVAAGLPAVDSALWLFNDEGEFQTFNDGGVPAELQVDLVGGQRYFFVVEGFDDVVDPTVPEPLDGGAIFIAVEANHNFDADNPGIDDHIDLPPATDPIDDRKRAAEFATPLILDEPERITDAFGNIVPDLGFHSQSFQEGRIHDVGDSDLFQFTPTIDLLGEFEGDSDGEGQAVFLGGQFQSANDGEPPANRVTIFDAEDFFPAGQQFLDGAVRDFVAWDPDGAGPAPEFLFAGGSFTQLDDADFTVDGLNTPAGGLAFFDPNAPANPLLTNPLAPRYNFAALGWNPNVDVGAWSPLTLDEGFNGSVNALAVFDPNPDDPVPGSLFVGGSFTSFDGQAATGFAQVDLAGFDPLTGAVSFSVTPIQEPSLASGEVNAFTVWDPESFEQGVITPPPPDMPDDPAELDTQDFDLPVQLVIGGAFTGGLRFFGITTDEGDLMGMEQPEFHSVPGAELAVNGTVEALSVFDPPDLGGPATPPMLVAGGSFSEASVDFPVSPPTVPPGATVDVSNIVGFELTDLTIDLGGGEFGTMSIFAPNDLGGGVNNTVFALTVYDPPDLGGIPAPPVLAAGGAFTDVGMRVAQWDGAQWSQIGDGFNGTVFELTVVDDDESIPIGLLTDGAVTDLSDDQEILHAGGAFTSTANAMAPVPVNHVARLLISPASGEVWEPLGGGVDDVVFAIEAFDDENTQARFDRHERPAPRASLVVQPTLDGAAFSGAFPQLVVNVFDSNFNLIYTNNTLSPFPEPTGGINPRRSAPGFNQNLVMPPMFAGEVYFIEVTNAGGRGRYTLSLETETFPPEGTEPPTDTGDSTITEEVDAGGFAMAPEMALLQGPGDFSLGTSFPNVTNIPSLFPLTGQVSRNFQLGGDATGVDHTSGQGLIHSVDDTDLFFFRAPRDGPVEIRLQTLGIQDFFQEAVTEIDDIFNPDINTINKTLDSPLDGALRIFNNDFEEIAFNDENPFVAAERDTTFAGSFAGLTFRERDPRVVFDAVGGEVYFIQVESGQKAAYEAATESGDFSEVDWASIVGGYSLFVNAAPSLTLSDDNIDFVPNIQAGQASAATPLTIDAATGQGEITGIISNTNANPDDADVFEYIAPASGIVTLSIERLSGQLVSQLTVVDGQGVNVVAQATASSDGFAQTQFSIQKGARVFIAVDGVSQAEGQYRLSVDGPAFTDDHGTLRKLGSGTPLELIDFLGMAQATGEIEDPGDVDIFSFTPTKDFDLATVTVDAVTPAFNPVVRVIEVQVDAVGNPYWATLSLDDNAAGGPNAQATFSFTPPERDTFLDDLEISFNTYYIIVSGADATGDSGLYTLSLETTPTDDHPDDGEFEFATPIIIAPTTGEGEEFGDLEMSGDSDLFTFVAPSGGFATVDVKAATSGMLRPTIRIFDASFNTVFTTGGLDKVVGSAAPGSTASFSFQVTRNETYFVLVEGQAGTVDGLTFLDTGQYEVEVAAPTLDDHANITEFDFATVIGLSVATGDGAATGVIGTVGDTDLFFTSALASGTVSFTVTAPADTIVPRARIFDASENELLVATDGGPGDVDGAADGSVTVSVESLAPGDGFFLLVDVADPLIPTGSYDVSVNGPIEGDGGGGGGGGGGGDPGDDDHADFPFFDDATPIELSALTGKGAETGVIETAGDTDLFRFTPLSLGRSFVQVLTPSGSLLDATVRVFDPGENEILVDTVGGFGVNAKGEFEITGSGAGGTGDYFILVEGVAGVGSYTVQLSTPPAEHVLYSPEGFANKNIREFVSITNSNSVAVTYSVVLRYEDPSLPDTVLVSNQVIGPNSRGGVTTSNGEKGVAPGVIKNAPYSIEIVSSEPLAASLSHYDFDIATGESFTNRSSAEWTFARAERVPGAVKDFVVFFNPNDHEVLVTLEAFGPNGVVTIQQVVQPETRGGWNLSALSSLPTGVFGLRVTSEAADVSNQADHIGIVASLSHFDVATLDGWSVLGDPDGGTLTSVVPTLENGDVPKAEVVVFNPGNFQAQVTIQGSFLNPGLPDIQRNIIVPARTTMTLTAPDLGLVDNQPIGLRFISNNPVTVQASEARFQDGNAAAALSTVGQEFFFGDGFINSKKAGTVYQETIDIFNPASQAIEVKLDITFSDGETASVSTTVGAQDFGRVTLHELPEILNHATLNWFGIVVSASSPFAVTMTHYDLFLNGGWTSAGAPIGLTVPLAPIA